MFRKNKKMAKNGGKMVYSPSTKSLAEMEKNIFGEVTIVTGIDTVRKNKIEKKSCSYR